MGWPGALWGEGRERSGLRVQIWLSCSASLLQGMRDLGSLTRGRSFRIFSWGKMLSCRQRGELILACTAWAQFALQPTVGGKGIGAQDTNIAALCSTGCPSRLPENTPALLFFVMGSVLTTSDTTWRDRAFPGQPDTREISLSHRA